MTTIWAQYALYNRRANERLYAACADLPGDRIWMTRFEGGGHPSTNLDAILFENFAALRRARAEMDRL